MNKIFNILFLSIMGLAAYTILMDTSEVQQTPVNDKATTYGEKGTRDNWPSQPDSNITLSENLNATNYYIIIDGSGSMADSKCSNNQTKMSVAQQSVNRFIDSLPASANVGIYAFDSYSASERHKLIDTNRDNAKKEVNKMIAGGGTPLGRSVSYAMEALSAQANKQLGYGEYHLVVVTDGEANDVMYLDKAINHVLSTSPVTIHTVGFCIGQNHTLNRKGYTLYHTANNPSSLMKGLNLVLAEAPTFNESSFNEEI